MLTGLDDSMLLERDELLARFIFTSDQFRSDGTVRPEAFIPPRTLDLSVSRTRGLSEPDIWELGLNAKGSRPNYYGRADFSVESAGECGMRVYADEPPDRHAIVVGWSGEKSEQKAQAIKLAKNARLVLKP